MKAGTSTTVFVLAYLFGAGFLTPSLAHAEDDGQLTEGARLFSTIAGVGCKTCHGEYAEGDVGVGPYIRGASEGSIRAAIDATGEMIVIKSVITEDEIKAVAAYVGKLGTMQAARTLAKRGRFLPAETSIRPGTDVQLIIQNSSIQPHTFKSDNLGIDELTIAGRSSGSIEWHAPEAEGEFSLYCIDCKLKDQFFTVHVAASAKEFRRIVPVTNAVDEAM
jgi:mono/diheme cytochrome c family protein